MTRAERLYAVKRAFEAAVLRMRRRPPKEYVRFQENCMRAIVGAAALLDRNPVALAADLADGRLAEYITAVEETIPLPLDDPATVRLPVEQTLKEAIQRAQSERKHLERRLQLMLRLFDRVTDDLRRRACDAEAWRREWFNTRAIYQLDDDWRMIRGLVGEPEANDTSS